MADFNIKSLLSQGTIDETGEHSAVDCLRTSSITVDSSLTVATVNASALLPGEWNGSTDGESSTAIPAISALGIGNYLNNPNWSIKYYWFMVYRSGDLYKVGSAAELTPVPGGNSEGERTKVYFRSVTAYTGGNEYGGNVEVVTVDIEGNSIYYYDGDTLVAKTCLQLFTPFPDPDTDSYSADQKAERGSEAATVEAALLGYDGSALVFNEHWKSSGSSTDLGEKIPYTTMRIVLTTQEGAAITTNNITAATLTLAASKWYLRDDDILDNSPLPDDIEGPTFTEPYPASFWYYDRRLGHLNMMLIPSELTYGEFEGTRPEQINVYDISEPQNGFDHNGLAILMPIECISDKEERGRWDLTLTHPIDDYKKWTYIVGQNVLKVNGQLFRIDETEIYQDADTAYITAHAQHITYDLFGRFVDELTVENASGGSYIEQVLQRSEEILPTHQPEPNEYTFDVSSNIEGPVTAKVQDQTVIGALFGDDNSLASRYGGQLYRDNFHMSINTTQAGAPTAPAFKLRFGTDLTKLSYKIDFSNWITELICVSNLGDLWAVSYTGSEWIIHHQRTRRMHFTYDPDTPDPFECLMRDGFAYWQTVNTPTVSIEVAVAALKNDPKYKDFVDLQNLDVGYTGNVYIEQYGIDINLKIVSIRRDELTGEALQVVLGTSRGSFIRSPVMSQTIVANGTVLGKQEAEMQAMKEQIDDMKIKQMRHWSGTKAYSWAEVKNYTWREIFVGHKN